MAETQAPKSAADVLAEILLQEKAEQAQERQVKKAKLGESDDRRKQQDADNLARQERQYANCDHLQGNHKLGESPFKEVGHMSLHTFGGPSTTDARRIRCNKCGHKWYPGDKAESYVRNGVRVNNPTGMGWKEAYKFVMRFKSMGNKPSAGFIDVFVIPPVHADDEE